MGDNGSTLLVPIGQIEYSRQRPLCCQAVGSCIALCLQDRMTGAAAMAHVFLPRSKDGAANTGGKYADTAVAEMAAALCPSAAPADRLQAYISGGARMFPVSTYNQEMDVGQLNSEAVLRELELRKIPVAFLDIGGTNARNVTFDVREKKMSVYHKCTPKQNV